jgi:NhaP-type Na+/H+ or K+/H+ antiporter
MALSKDTQDKLIGAVVLLGVCGLGVLAHWLGADVLAATLIGGALGNAAPAPRRAPGAQ